ncbi:hypothetical protein BX600DRAFT_554779 [Xylariales sp. PMI_506]|nr:hypothetical protein BX600DRAFT_554779 [Xylariales sp. PMI_506]
MVLQVGIIGAGIAGLSAAIALRRAGVQVEIFEKSKFSNEIGAGITITPNATKLLDRWGFSHDRAGAVPQLVRHHIKYDTLELLDSGSLEPVPRIYGSPFVAYHRADLHAELKQLALGDDGPGEKATLRLVTKVVELDVENGNMVLDDGTKVHKDLVVVASGQWSEFPDIVAQPLTPRGAIVYRTLIPMDNIQAIPELATLFDLGQPGFRFFKFKVDNMVTYYCRSATLLSIAWYHIVPPASLGDENTIIRDWNTPVSTEDVIATLPTDRHPTIELLLRQGKTWAAFSLPQRPQLETFARGRTVVIGDAAHLMMPTHAQGATLAIEEAASVGVFCSDVTAEQIPSRVQQWNEFITDHSLAVQELSNAILEPAAYARAQARSKKPVFPRNISFYSEPREHPRVWVVETFLRGAAARVGLRAFIHRPLPTPAKEIEASSASVLADGEGLLSAIRSLGKRPDFSQLSGYLDVAPTGEVTDAMVASIAAGRDSVIPS